MEAYVPFIWALLIAAAVALYVILDGFDLGIGILSPFARKQEHRNAMINSIAPFWDGNETWLVLGGGGLWVAFPDAYAVIMPAMYLPVIVMLLALIFRGVSFEFREVAKSHHRRWDYAFAGGSIIAAFMQGVILGGLLQGITVVEGRFAGGPFDWLSPFALMCGLGLLAGYALLGATWLILRTEGSLAEYSRRQARVLLVAVLGFIALVSLWTPLGIERIATRWFSTPNIFFLWPVPLLTALLALAVWRGLDRRREAIPFLGSAGLFLLCYLGLAISTFPYIVPPSLTIVAAAAVPESQVFSLIGVVFLLPIILGYTAFVYWTFLRGKVAIGESYHAH
ncbi:MAG TPA: cytochrome d ubiquinol oxidase subunit II [Bauldia sp.]|nr:cytochrome d ubiquinol oxidase subunit II [Bauldia sp.]